MFQEISSIAILVLGTGSIASVALYVYYLYFFTRLKPNLPVEKNIAVPVSVIIAARNERINLAKNLPSVLKQNYENYEVVVINDGSWDGSKDLLSELSRTESRLKIVNLELDEKFHRGKKFALTMGIKAATHEHLLFMDADCTPAGDRWIASMMHHLVHKQVVLGNSPLTVNKNLLGSIVNYETFHTAVQYLGYARRGIPYMGVGRNLGYTKSVFFANKGFASHQHIMSGDDDLFVQEVARADTTSISLDPNSFTYSPGPENTASWIKQKIRHLSTGKLYKTKFKLLLGMYSVFHLLVYICVIAFMCIEPDVWYIGIALLATKWIVQWIVFYGPSHRLGYKKIGYALPYYDILYTIFLLFFGLAKPFLKPKTWN